MRRGLAIAALALPCLGCAAPQASLRPAPAPAASEPAPSGAPAAASPAPAAKADDPCQRDADCGYDPASGRCGADPRYNRQPPVVDQGIVCYCGDPSHDGAASGANARGRACAALRVLPVPCEGDEVCAVDPSPRPHPVRASAAHPHERGKRCKDFAIMTTCERTNICTMHRLECPR